MSESRRGAFSLRARVASFGPAFRGVASLLRNEHNAWIHAGASLAAIGLGILLEITRVEWLVVILAMVVVWVAEALNAALEALCDVVSPTPHPGIKAAKDAAAGGVLMAALGALAIGLIVFGRRLLFYVSELG